METPKREQNGQRKILGFRISLLETGALYEGGVALLCVAEATSTVGLETDLWVPAPELSLM